MNKSEHVSYTVTGYNFKEISRGKGSIEYQLMDEYGNERMVTAMAKLNLFKKVSSIKPIYHRELPLITALAETKLNESIVVDFSEFNKNNPRPLKGRSKASIPAVQVKSSQGMISLATNKKRLLQLMAVPILALLLFVFVV